MDSDRPLWTCQVKAIEMVDEAVLHGYKAPCIVAPPGAGKTTIISHFIKREIARGKTFLQYVHRRLLLDQTSGVFDDADISHGVIMSNTARHRKAILREVQLATLQSMASWVASGKLKELPKVDYVLIDEPHAFASGQIASDLIRMHKEHGSIIIGTTATPVGLKGNFDKLLIAATTPELIAAGQLVKAYTYSPNQPDLHKIKKTVVGEYSVGDVVKVMRLQSIVGNIIDNYRRLNIDQVSSLFFGPDVASTRWCIEQFNSAGIAATGIFDDTPDDERLEIANGSKSGKWKIVGNRFVIREGIDWPWIKHLIFGTAFGALSTYIQVGGRGMRAYDGFDKCIVQDHGGNYHRHGSLNAAIDWTLDDTDSSIAKKRSEAIQERKVKEPIRCPSCGFERMGGEECPACHHKHKKSVRMIIQEDGHLHRQVGNLIKIKVKKTGLEKQASGLFFMAANGRGMTVSQLSGLYYKKYGEPFPDGAMKLRGKPVVLPSRNSMDWDRKVSHVWPEARRRSQ